MHDVAGLMCEVRSICYMTRIAIILSWYSCKIFIITEFILKLIHAEKSHWFTCNYMNTDNFYFVHHQCWCGHWSSRRCQTAATQIRTMMTNIPWDKNKILTNFLRTKDHNLMDRKHEKNDEMPTTVHIWLVKLTCRVGCSSLCLWPHAGRRAWPQNHNSHYRSESFTVRKCWSDGVRDSHVCPMESALLQSACAPHPKTSPRPSPRSWSLCVFMMMTSSMSWRSSHSSFSASWSTSEVNFSARRNHWKHTSHRTNQTGYLFGYISKKRDNGNWQIKL